MKSTAARQFWIEFVDGPTADMKQLRNGLIAEALVHLLDKADGRQLRRAVREEFGNYAHIVAANALVPFQQLSNKTEGVLLPRDYASLTNDDGKDLLSRFMHFWPNRKTVCGFRLSARGFGDCGSVFF
jgi:hypothetical protein